MAVHGSKATLRVGSSATPAVLQDLSVYANSLGQSFSRDNADTSTMGTTAKKHVPGLTDSTLPFAGPYDTAADPILWDLFNTGAVVTVEYCPAGNGVVGTPKYTAQAFLTTYDMGSPVGGAGTISAAFQVTGVVTRAVQ